MKLTFLGASRTVTGSKYLLELNSSKIMVDCGLFQGLKELRLLNWQTPSFNPAQVDAVLLTHGHLDHTGYLPRLVKHGFKGAIYGTAPTLEVASIILKDSAKIQEEEAERANREGYSKHKPALPLYDLEDVALTEKLFKEVPEGQWLDINTEVKAIFEYNGHILGSTFIQIRAGGKTLVFSGDLGREEDLMLYAPKKPREADLLLLESTYGGKIHPDERDFVPDVERIVNETIARKGSVFIPTFAVERMQLLMFILWRLRQENRIPAIPMYVDSPMGAQVLNLFRHSQQWHKIAPSDYQEMCSLFKVVSKFDETMALRHNSQPKIVIAGSGMLTGGRMLSYLEVQAPVEKNTLLFVGYQAEGTRGRQLLDGMKTIKIYGKMVPFRLQISKVEGLSAHADQKELIHWLSDIKTEPSEFYLIHGEVDQSQALQQKILAEKGWHAQIPNLNQTIEL